MKIVNYLILVILCFPMNVYAESKPSPNQENWVTYCIQHKVTKSNVCFSSIIPSDDEDGIIVILNPMPEKSEKLTLSYGGINGYNCGQTMEFKIDDNESIFLDKAEINARGEKNKNISNYASYNIGKVFLNQLKSGKSGVGNCGNAKFNFTLRGFTKAISEIEK